MKIHNKLFIVFISFSAFLVISLMSLVQWSIDKGMIEYVNQREINALKPFTLKLADIYQEHNDWQILHDDNRRFERLLRESLQGSDFSLPPPRKRPPPRQRNDDGYPRRKRDKDNWRESPRPEFERHRPSNNEFQERRRKKEPKLPPPKREYLVSYVLLDENKEYVVGNYDQAREYNFQSLQVNNNVIGFLGVSKREHLTKGYDFDFVEQQKNYLWYAALIVMLVVMLITFPLARHLVAPIRAFTKGMHQLTQGEYKSRLSINRKDEFSQLSRDFNELAKTLMENDSARKRWLANISHELRTPVAILKGELEAVIDGIRELSIEHVHSAHQEVVHLQRLIADLHALTSADIGGMSYRKEKVNLITFIAHEFPKLENYLQQQNLTLEKVIQVDKSTIFADTTRLNQLLENLLNNSIKYAKTGSKVRISLLKTSNRKTVQLVIEDDGVGVDEKHFELLFEHLYRVEDSRNRETGGSGLGLSICAHIVQAHQGEICAKESSLGGLAIHITLPLI